MLNFIRPTNCFEVKRKAKRLKIAAAAAAAHSAKQNHLRAWKRNASSRFRFDNRQALKEQQ